MDGLRDDFKLLIHSSGYVLHRFLSQLLDPAGDDDEGVK